MKIYLQFKIFLILMQYLKIFVWNFCKKVIYLIGGMLANYIFCRKLIPSAWADRISSQLPIAKGAIMKCKLFLSVICFLIFGGSLSYAKELNFVLQSTVTRDSVWIDANQIAMIIMNNGTFARDPQTGNAAFFYPRGTNKSAIYAAGLRIAGKVNGEIRTACADYNVEYQPGVILPDGKPDNPDLEKYRIYKIKPGDSANPNDPNYNKDYAEWPVSDGAPLDATGKPLILGDQTIWCVMNDGDQNLHGGCYNTKPLNIEVQLLSWAYHDDTTPLGRTAFFQYTIVNKSPDTIEDVYIGIWSDPDLGDAIDDEMACDTTLNLTYAYNGKDTDGIYGIAVPAVGFCLLQGPAITSPGETAFQFMHHPLSNAKLLGMTSSTVYY
jgi:hypothetical protein